MNVGFGYLSLLAIGLLVDLSSCSNSWAWKVYLLVIEIQLIFQMPSHFVIFAPLAQKYSLFSLFFRLPVFSLRPFCLFPLFPRFRYFVFSPSLVNRLS